MGHHPKIIMPSLLARKWYVLLFLVLLSETLCHRPYVHRPLHSDGFRVN